MLNVTSPCLVKSITPHSHSTMGINLSLKTSSDKYYTGGGGGGRGGGGGGLTQ